MDYQDVRSLLWQYSDPSRVSGQEAYMRKQFPYMGVRADGISAVVGQTAKRLWPSGIRRADSALQIVQLQKLCAQLFFRAQYREEKYCAIHLLKRYSSKLNREAMPLLCQMVQDEPWWDTVDLIASSLMGVYFRLYPENRNRYVQEWADSPNIWLNRCAIIFQLRYHEQTDTELLFQLCRRFEGSCEFFIQKAMGWALREVAKQQQQLVIDFLDQTRTLPNLTVREAKKHFAKSQTVSELRGKSIS